MKVKFKLIYLILFCSVFQINNSEIKITNNSADFYYSKGLSPFFQSKLFDYHLKDNNIVNESIKVQLLKCIIKKQFLNI